MTRRPEDGVTSPQRANEPWRRTLRGLVALTLLATIGCGGTPATSVGDAGGGDVGFVDAGASDVGGGDTGGSDARVLDARVLDARVLDVGGSDVGASDVGGSDVGAIDVGGSDVGAIDVGGGDVVGSDVGAVRPPASGQVVIDACLGQTGIAERCTLVTNASACTGARCSKLVVVFSGGEMG